MEEHRLTCVLNNVEIHTFTEIAEEVIPCICIGAINMHFTVSCKEYTFR